MTIHGARENGGLSGVGGHWRVLRIRWRKYRELSEGIGEWTVGSGCSRVASGEEVVRR